MPITIVRNDITKMKTDAIVNSTNPEFIPGGNGVDMTIHTAAGPELAKALENAGKCDFGSSVITPAFGELKCKYIIHTCAPVYLDGNSGEEALLQSCYRSIFRLAVENGCRSVAIPILSAGAYGYPIHRAYLIATNAAREFSLLFEGDLNIYIVVHDERMAGVGRKAGDNVIRSEADEGPVACGALPRANISAAECISAPLNDDYRSQDLDFGGMCEWWRAKKGLEIGSFYQQANIDRRTYWAVCHKTKTVPKKTTVLAIVIGLRLKLDEAEDLLKRSGLALSPYIALDREIIECLQTGQYNIDEINFRLYVNKLGTIGSLVR